MEHNNIKYVNIQLDNKSNIIGETARTKFRNRESRNIVTTTIDQSANLDKCEDQINVERDYMLFSVDSINIKCDRDIMVQDINVFAIMYDGVTNVMTVIRNKNSMLPFVEYDESNESPTDIVNRLNMYLTNSNRKISMIKVSKRDVITKSSTIDKVINVQNFDYETLFNEDEITQTDAKNILRGEVQNLLALITSGQYMSTVPSQTLLEFVLLLVSGIV